jgi:hypothetical protein
MGKHTYWSAPATKFVSKLSRSIFNGKLTDNLEVKFAYMIHFWVLIIGVAILMHMFDNGILFAGSRIKS